MDGIMYFAFASVEAMRGYKKVYHYTSQKSHEDAAGYRIMYQYEGRRRRFLFF